MNTGISAFELLSIPDKDFDRNVFFDSFGREPFMLVYDMSSRTTKLIMPQVGSADRIRQLSRSIPGMGFAPLEALPFSSGKHRIFAVYRKPDMIEKNLFSGLFDLGLLHGALAVAFVPFKEEKLEHAKMQMEMILSRRNARETRSMLSDVFSKRMNTSLQRENFEDSEETMFMTETLESVNRSILRNGVAYGIFLITDDSTGTLERYVESRFLVLSRGEHSSTDLLEKPDLAYKLDVFPVGLEVAAKFLAFIGSFELRYVLPTVPGRSQGDIALGTYMQGSASDTEITVAVEHSSFNLGSIITGLPGSGKTKEAMSIIDELLGIDERPMAIVVSPTDEWNAFASSHGMHVVRIFDGKTRTPINFFKVPEGANISKFYEDLAMILSSASSAGPYTNPMEKCMLNAFRNIYSATRKPDPVDVYNEIEESIIKFHAKRTNTGVKYTKHGENIKSALENLRAILSRPEYAVVEGALIEELAGNGVVFDLSNVSVSTKPYLYALILNQVYSLASQFDTNGDDKLRLLLCIEEAQIIFRDKDSTAAQDLKYRIQDFRKQGIGIMLLAHNVNDIEPSIRRLCQVKLYLKQAPDVAAFAARDLTFTYADDDQAVQKLKHLDSRIGALSYVAKRGSEKLSNDTVFIRTKEYQEKEPLPPVGIKSRRVPRAIDSVIEVRAQEGPDGHVAQEKHDATELRILYLGEEIFRSALDPEHKTECRLIEGKHYTIELLDRRGRKLKAFEARAEKRLTLISD